MANSKLSIVVPAFSGHNQIKRCLLALNHSVYQDFNTVIVDHGITDEITRWVNTDFPQATCIRGSAELWWSGATNLGIRYALDNGSSLVMLLNHDCYVRPDTIGNLLSHVENTSRTIVAPAQHNLRTNKTIYTATSCFLLGFPTFIPPFQTGRLHGNNALIQTSMIVGGRGVIVSAAVFKDIGLLDEEGLPHYGSDNDFYMRCKSAGYKLCVSTKAKVLIDSRYTTLASGIASLTTKKFILTLKDRRSHRNIKDQIQLFRRYYPVPGLYPIGVAMNLLRYFSIYLILRSRYLVVNFFRQKN